MEKRKREETGRKSRKEKKGGREEDGWEKKGKKKGDADVGETRKRGKGYKCRQGEGMGELEEKEAWER